MRARQRPSSDSKAALQVLHRAFRVLDLFTIQRPEWTVTEVAADLGLPLSTTHRILRVLLEHGFLRREPTSRRFRLGIAAVDLGVRGRASMETRAVFVESLRGLSEATGETAILCTLDASGTASFCVDRVESDEPLRLSVEPGRTLPLHAGAMGKALLAFLPPGQQEAVLRAPLSKLCTGTITSRTRLRAELEVIADRGYSTSFEETNPGLWGAAVPILDSRGSAYASIGTAGPLLRYSPDRLAREVISCQEAAAEIAAALGLAVWRAAPDTRAPLSERASRTDARSRIAGRARIARVAPAKS